MNEYSTKLIFEWIQYKGYKNIQWFISVDVVIHKKRKEKIMKTKNRKQRKGEIKLEFILEFLKKEYNFFHKCYELKPRTQIVRKGRAKKKKQKEKDKRIMIWK